MPRPQRPRGRAPVRVVRAGHESREPGRRQTARLINSPRGELMFARALPHRTSETRASIGVVAAVICDEAAAPARETQAEHDPVCVVQLRRMARPRANEAGQGPRVRGGARAALSLDARPVELILESLPVGTGAACGQGLLEPGPLAARAGWNHGRSEPGPVEPLARLSEWASGGFLSLQKAAERHAMAAPRSPPPNGSLSASPRTWLAADPSSPSGPGPG